MLKRGRACAVVNELATHQRLETAARFAARTGASDESYVHHRVSIGNGFLEY